jgi:glycosyltransferase involved in cell wall biosynthesis
VRVADYSAWSDGGPRRAAPEPHSLIYTGSFQYAANYDAMVWFLGQVWPQVRAALPDARLRITGEHAGLPLPTTEGVILTGLVPDVRPLVAESWAALAPLQSGGGTRLKILEAMALGTPVVATSKGAEGLDAQPEVHLLVADDPADFAAAVIRLLQDASLRRALARRAQTWVAAHYDWDEILPQFLQVVDAAAVTRPVGSR